MRDGASVNIMQEALFVGLGNQRLRGKKTITHFFPQHLIVFTLMCLKVEQADEIIYLTGELKIEELPFFP